MKSLAHAARLLIAREKFTCRLGSAFVAARIEENGKLSTLSGLPYVKVFTFFFIKAFTLNIVTRSAQIKFE